MAHSGTLQFLLRGKKVFFSPPRFVVVILSMAGVALTVRRSLELFNDPRSHADLNSSMADMVAQHTVPELKEFLGETGLSRTGLKDDLVKRVVAIYGNSAHDATAATDEAAARMDASEAPPSVQSAATEHIAVAVNVPGASAQSAAIQPIQDTASAAQDLAAADSGDQTQVSANSAAAGTTPMSSSMGRRAVGTAAAIQRRAQPY